MTRIFKMIFGNPDEINKTSDKVDRAFERNLQAARELKEALRNPRPAISPRLSQDNYARRGH